MLHSQAAKSGGGLLLRTSAPNASAAVLSGKAGLVGDVATLSMCALLLCASAR